MPPGRKTVSKRPVYVNEKKPLSKLEKDRLRKERSQKAKIQHQLDNQMELLRLKKESNEMDYQINVGENAAAVSIQPIGRSHNTRQYDNDMAELGASIQIEAQMRGYKMRKNMEPLPPINDGLEVMLRHLNNPKDPNPMLRLEERVTVEIERMNTTTETREVLVDEDGYEERPKSVLFNLLADAGEEEDVVKPNSTLFGLLNDEADAADEEEGPKTKTVTTTTKTLKNVVSHSANNNNR